jgi:hypothetical protein
MYNDRATQKLILTIARCISHMPPVTRSSKHIVIRHYHSSLERARVAYPGDIAFCCLTAEDRMTRWMSPWRTDAASHWRGWGERRGITSDTRMGAVPARRRPREGGECGDRRRGEPTRRFLMFAYLPRVACSWTWTSLNIHVFWGPAVHNGERVIKYNL